MSIKKHRRQQSENAASDSSVSSRDISQSVSGKEHIILALVSLDYPPIITVPASPNMDQDSSDTPGLTDLYLGSQHVQDLTLNRLGGLNLCIAWGGRLAPPPLEKGLRE